MAIKCPQCGAEYDVTLFTLDRSIRCDCGANVDLAVGHQQSTKDGMQAVSPEANREGVSADNEPERNGINALGDAVPVEAPDARVPADTPASVILHPRWRIFGLIVVHIVVGWVGAYLAFSAGRDPTLYAAVFVGLIFSQVSLLGIWGRLGTGLWWMRLTGVVVGIGYYFLVFGIVANDVSIETLIVFLTAITVVSIPLLIARFFRIVIRRGDSPVVPVDPIQFSIRHLIIATFVVACLITIGKLVQPLLSRRPDIELLAIAVTFGLIGVLPVWFALASKRPTVFSIGVVIVGAYVGYCYGFKFRDEELVWTTVAATEALSVAVTLLLVRSWGYRLVRLPKRTPRGSRLEEITTRQVGNKDSQSSSLLQ